MFLPSIPGSVVTVDRGPHRKEQSDSTKGGETAIMM